MIGQHLTCNLVSHQWSLQEFLNIPAKSNFILKPKPQSKECSCQFHWLLGWECKLQTLCHPDLWREVLLNWPSQSVRPQGAQNIKFRRLPGWDSDAAVDSLTYHLRGQGHVLGFPQMSSFCVSRNQGCVNLREQHRRTPIAHQNQSRASFWFQGKIPGNVEKLQGREQLGNLTE